MAVWLFVAVATVARVARIDFMVGKRGGLWDKRIGVVRSGFLFAV
jgi:hypothetical protein